MLLTRHSSRLLWHLMLIISLFVACSTVKLTKVSANVVMVWISHAIVLSKLVPQLVLLLLNLSVNLVLSLRCVHSTQDESRKKEEISQPVLLVSKNSSKLVLRNISRKSVISMVRLSKLNIPKIQRLCT